MPSNKKKYDLIFSMGAACSCSQALRKSGLQLASYPLDWLFGSDFKNRTDLFVADFADFVNQQDLEYAYSERSITCDAYYNKYNDITFNHDFPASVPLAESYASVKEKYNRRISRLLANVDNAEKILLVYIETPDCQVITPEDEIIRAFAKVQNKYVSKKVELLYIATDKTMNPCSYKKKQLTADITKITSNYKSQEASALPYVVNGKFLVKLLKDYKLNLPFMFRVKKFLLSTCIKIIPVKSCRKKLKKKYHVK